MESVALYANPHADSASPASSKNTVVSGTSSHSVTPANSVIPFCTASRTQAASTLDLARSAADSADPCAECEPLAAKTRSQGRPQLLRPHDCVLAQIYGTCQEDSAP